MIVKFKDVVQPKDGFLRGPFGSALKKSLFVPKNDNTYKVYEQCVPLEQNENLGKYYISEEYFKEKMYRFEARPKDFLISCSGVNYGAIYQLSENAEPGIINQALLRVRLNNEVIDDNYFLYLFRGLIHKKITTGTGDSTIPNFPSMDVVKNIEFSLPDIETQKMIGSIFFEIDKKINNNDIINTTLELVVRTIYDYWFLQFEFPNKKGNPYMSFGGEMVWNDELKRKIPKGWNVQNLIHNSLCKPIKNGLKPFELKCYLPTGNINGEDIIDGDYVTPDNKESRANMQPSKYSVWFAKMKNSIKHISIPDNSDWFIDKYILSTGMEGLQCKQDTFAYVHSLINSVFFEKQKDILAHGATQESVNDQDLTNVKFVIPDDDTLKRYCTIINPYLEMKFSLFRQNQELAKLRDFLLPMLMNGQVTFKEEA